MLLIPIYVQKEKDHISSQLTSPYSTGENHCIYFKPISPVPSHKMSRRCQYLTGTGLPCSKPSQVAPCPWFETAPGACSEHHGQPWKFRIMDLPLELREMIISYYLPESIRKRLPVAQRDENTGCGRILNIMLAAKQISNEVRTVLYKQNSFEVKIDIVSMDVRFCNQPFKLAPCGKMLNNQKHPQDAHFNTNFCAIAKNIRKFVVFIKLEIDCWELQTNRQRLRNGINLFMEMIARDPSNQSKEHRTLDVKFCPIPCTWLDPKRQAYSAVLETAREVVDTFQSLEDVSMNLCFENLYIKAYGFESGRLWARRVSYNTRKERGRWVVDDGIEAVACL